MLDILDDAIAGVENRIVEARARHAKAQGTRYEDYQNGLITGLCVYSEELNTLKKQINERIESGQF